MALSIYGRAAGAVGPGYSLSLNSSLVGPINNPAWWSVQMRPHLAGNFIASGSKKNTFGSHNEAVVIGILDPRDGPRIGLLDAVVAVGATLDLDLYLTDAAFNNIDGPTTITAAWTWDPTGGLYILTGQPTNLSAQILAAVTKTVVNSP